MSDKSNAQKMADWKLRFPERHRALLVQERRRRGVPMLGNDATVAVWADEMLAIVFGVDLSAPVVPTVPYPPPLAEAVKVLDLEPGAA